jgi:hypothetical protein
MNFDTVASGTRSRLRFNALERYSIPGGAYEASAPTAQPSNFWEISQDNGLDGRYQVIVCDNGAGPPCNLHIKGIVAGQVTAVAPYIHLEGDIVYNNQSIDPAAPSTDMFGAVAKNDLVVPVGIPQGKNFTYQNDALFPEADRIEGPDNPHQNVTNFIPNTPDRDVALAALPNPIVQPWDGKPNYWVPPIGWTYPWVWGWVSSGYTFNLSDIHAKNQVHTLELDGSFVALKGDLSLEGLNDWDINPDTGRAFYALDGHVYSAKRGVGVTNSFYDATGSPTASPLFCYAPNWPVGACPPNMEALRPLNNQIQVYGGMTTSNYSKVQAGTSVGPHLMKYGFSRRTIIADPRMENTSPPAFPDSGSPYVMVLTLKAYPGEM